MKYRWQIAAQDPSLAARLAAELNISRNLAQLLVNRGHSESAACSAFLHPRLKQLSDPFLLPNMEAAIQRLLLAHERAEAVVLFGDYDVDGVTATALLYEVLTALGWKAAYYLPHRRDEGYGLSTEGVENCVAKHKPSLLVAIDCGTNSVAASAYLHDRGIDLIVIDHHQAEAVRPAAVAVVNPQLGQDFRELCSAGLAFKVAHAMVKRTRELGWPAAQTFDLRNCLDLVALGTIADVVPLKGENRILVSAGLERLNERERPGVTALKRVSQIRDSVGVHEVGFQLGPRLNAAGRLETATHALELLLTTDIAEAMPRAVALDAQNRERQQLEKSIADQVLAALRAKFDPEKDFAIVEGETPWHVGVIGIVASRVLREFNRPTIIMGGDGLQLKGSGRSIEGFDLAAALRECNDLLVRHGGHAMAAGLSILPERIAEFRARLNELVRKAVAPGTFLPALKLDCEVSLEDLTLEFAKHLTGFEPMGQGNPPVQVVVRQVTLDGPPQKIGNQQQHAKFSVKRGGARRDVIWFQCDAIMPETEPIDLALHPSVNRYNGREYLQLRMLDWRANSVSSAPGAVAQEAGA